MDNTPRWSLPFLAAGQAQKELYHNEALTIIDALLHGRAESADLSAPPLTPEAGRCWIVGPNASGAWSGRDADIACWSDGGWRFIVPRRGLTIDVSDKGYALCYDGEQWRAAAIRGDGLYVGNQRVVGPRQSAISIPSTGGTIDTEARATIAAILSMLRAHGLISS